MARGRDVIDIVEAAYNLEPDNTQWLSEILRACEPGFVDAHGAAAAMFEREQPDPTRVLSSEVNHSMDPHLLDTMRAGFEQGTDAERDRSLRQGGPVLRLSTVLGGPLAANPMYRGATFDDIVVLRAVNPDGSGAFFVAPVSRRGTSTMLGLWPKLAAHVAAALRLRRRAPTVDRADAVLTPDGELVAGSASAISSRDVLRAAARRIDRAHGAGGRRDPIATIDAWTALIDGRWSLVDHFESDGKRFVLAVENPADAPDPRALTPEERPILHLVAMGHSNKLVAYELGIPIGTVGTRLASVMRKLGVATRVAIIDRYTTLRGARVAALDAGVQAASAPSPTFAALTPAEAEVAKMAARGYSNERIAKARGCAVPTVANLLRRVYAKLGVDSRAALATVAHH